MKYIRGSILRKGPVLQGFRFADVRYRSFRGLPAFRSCKVKYSSSNSSPTMTACRFFTRRQVSTGPRKSQMAVVAPSKISLVPPKAVEIKEFLPSSHRKTPNNRCRDSVAQSKHSEFLPTTSYGDFLSTTVCSTAFNSFELESPFLPTFHSYHDQLLSMFEDNSNLNMNQKVSSSAKSSEEHLSVIVDDKDEIPNVTLDNPNNFSREVKKNVVLPRLVLPLATQDCLQTFADIHKFDESDEKSNNKKKDTSIFPVGGDGIVPMGQFIIHSDRSAYIINKDLYITNRILDKLKKRDKPQPNDGESSEPIKASSSCEGLNKTPQSTTESNEQIPENISELVTNPPPLLAHKSNFNFLPSDGSDLNPVPNEIVGEEVGRSSETTDFSSVSVELKDSFQRNLDGYFPDNVEFSNPPIKRLSPLEFKAFESRKNLYKQLLRNTPCYLVDGLHVTNNSEGHYNLPQNSKQVEDSKPCGRVLEYSLMNSDLKDTEVGFPSEQADSEEWLAPLNHDIDIMLKELTETQSKSEAIDESHLNSDSEFQRAENPIIDIELGGDHTVIPGFIVSEIHFKSGMIPFEGLQNVESSLSKFGTPPVNSPPSNGRCSSTSAPQKPPSPPKQSNPNVDIKTETTIKCCRSGDKTDINVVETQRYLDKRLPYPFSTETVLQVVGTNSSLYKATQAVENSKSQLVHLSNANAPNPGMAVPKLQFNHMLSKTHEITNNNSTNKKTVLPIKTVTGSSPNNQYTFNPSISSSDPTPVSHVVHFPKPVSEINRDVHTRSDLTRRNKYPQKNVLKKVRRSDSVKQLKSKKKSLISEDVGENITVLGPKDLERMFPTPPKPKPVEKPRNVTINNQAANTKVNYSAMNLDEASKAISKITLKAKKQKDKWVLVKKKGNNQIDDVARGDVPQVPLKVRKETDKKDQEVGLSARDQKILKSLINDKVKGSYTTVTHRKNPTQTSESKLNKQEKKLSGVSDSSPTNKVQKNVTREAQEPSISQAKSRLFKSIFKTSGPHVPSPIRNDEPVATKGFDIIEKQKTWDDSPLGLVVGKEQTIDSVKKRTVERESKPNLAGKDGISSRGVSPTPLHNREYFTIDRINQGGNVKDRPEQSEVGNLATVQNIEVTGGEAPREVDQAVGSTVRSVPSESLAGRLNAVQNNRSGQKFVVNETQSSSKRAEQVSRSNKPEFNSEKSSTKSKIKNFVQSQSQETKMSRPISPVEKLERRINKQLGSFMFFPFEAPTVKESIVTPQGESLPLSQSSSDPEVYETDFCKIGCESKPGLDATALASLKVPLSRVKEFPMVNSNKMSYPTMKAAISIKPDTDMMLRRTLSQMPAVTKVLGATLSAKSQQALDKWKEGLVKTLGEDGFKRFVENQLKEGSTFHNMVGKFLLNQSDCKDDLCMKSMSNVFPNITDIGVIESQVVHPQLAYRGVVDCVAKYKGKPVVIEWKRSDKAKPTIKHTYDAPLQLSAYIGALNFDNNYKLQVDGGLVVVAHSDGSPADVFEIPLEECQRYWNKWLKRLYQFHSRA